MKKLYTTLLLLICTTGALKLSAQCSAGINISTNGRGGYTFTATNLTDTTAYTQYIWSLNNTTIDSTTLTTTQTLHSNGNYQICLHLADTSTGCAFDTCKTFSVTDAEYHPLLDTINEWHLIYNECVIGQTAPHNTQSRSGCYALNNGDVVYTTADTIINAISYKPLVAATSPNSNACTIAYIREDVPNRKVFIYQADGNHEQLLYNFAMQVGDTTPIRFNQQAGFSHDDTYRLDSIKTISINETLRKVLFLNSLHYPAPNKSFTLVWVEGIGNLGHPAYLSTGFDFGSLLSNSCSNIYPYSNIVPKNMSNVVCFRHHDFVYFDTCSYNIALNINCDNVTDSCNYSLCCSGGAIHEVSSLSNFNLSPNPSTGTVQIDMQVQTATSINLRVLDISGQTIFYQTSTGTLPTGAFHKTLNLSALPSGMYLLEAATPQGSLYKKLLIVN